MSDTHTLSVLDDTFIVCRFEASAVMPQWALDGPGFVATCRTDEELSIVCGESRVPAIAADTPRWRGLKVHGPFSFDTIGVLASISRTLADARISLLAISTFDTDYVFVRSADLAHAVRALRHASHIVHTAGE